MLSSLLFAGLLFGVPSGLEPIDDTPWIVVEAPTAAEACCFLIDFEDAAPGECLNDRYRNSHGIALDRPDSACIAAVDWSARGLNTSSPPIVLSTEANDRATIDSPILIVRDVGVRPFRFTACFGNDRTLARFEITSIHQSGGSGGWGPLNGNVHVDSQRYAGWGYFHRLNWKDSVRDGIAMDSMLVSRCPNPRVCSLPPRTQIPRDCE